MRNLIAACVVYACFTSPQGEFGIWVAKSSVIMVTHPTVCPPGANAQIVTSYGGGLCVRETPQQVLKTLDKLKD